eukprot:UN11136
MSHQKTLRTRQNRHKIFGKNTNAELLTELIVDENEELSMPMIFDKNNEFKDVMRKELEVEYQTKFEEMKNIYDERLERENADSFCNNKCLFLLSCFSICCVFFGLLYVIYWR